MVIIHLHKYLISKEVLVVSGEALVQPQVVPEVTGDEIPEPHVSDLVRQNVCNDLLAVVIRVFLVVHDICLPVSITYQLFHCAISERFFTNPAPDKGGMC